MRNLRAGVARTKCSRLSASARKTGRYSLVTYWRALHLGAPPHGGIAFGLIGLVMLIAGEQSIRDGDSIPKTIGAWT